jgi:CheY-like chemotaxis protein
MLPDATGIDICRQLRTSHDTPLIVLSVVGDERTAIAALTGARRLPDEAVRQGSCGPRGGVARGGTCARSPHHVRRAEHRQSGAA